MKEFTPKVNRRKFLRKSAQVSAATSSFALLGGISCHAQTPPPP